MHEELIEAFALDGRVAVITGAASGIGRETARMLAQAGATVVLGDVDQEGLAAAQSLIEEIGAGAISHAIDVSKRADVESIADCALEAYGQIDIWVNCAGILPKTSMLDATESDLDRGIAVNLKGVYWGCVEAGRAMKDAGRGGPSSTSRRAVASRLSRAFPSIA